MHDPGHKTSARLDWAREIPFGKDKKNNDVGDTVV